MASQQEQASYKELQEYLAEYLWEAAQKYDGFAHLPLEGNSHTNMAVDDYCILAKHIMGARIRPRHFSLARMALNAVIKRRTETNRTHEYMLQQMKRLRELFRLIEDVTDNSIQVEHPVDSDQLSRTDEPAPECLETTVNTMMAIEL
ncbi:hypothetical protein PGQ11_000923 [Apiospora arundinis]